MKKFILLVLCLILIGCAKRNELVGVVDASGSLSGFWPGLLHGFISPFALIISLFKHDINIYAVHNTGFGYNAGFMLGVLCIASSCKEGCKEAKKKRC